MGQGYISIRSSIHLPFIIVWYSFICLLASSFDTHLLSSPSLIVKIRVQSQAVKNHTKHQRNSRHRYDDISRIYISPSIPSHHHESSFILQFPLFSPSSLPISFLHPISLRFSILTSYLSIDPPPIFISKSKSDSFHSEIRKNPSWLSSPPISYLYLLPIISHLSLVCHDTNPNFSIPDLHQIHPFIRPSFLQSGIKRLHLFRRYNV